MADCDLISEHFRLRERPFKVLPDPEYLYWTPQHRRAFAVIEYGVMTRAPITLITGEVGSGKTTLIRKLLDTIDDSVTCALISSAVGDGRDLLLWVLKALSIDVTPGANYVDLFHALEGHLVTAYAEQRSVVLLFDEAQNISVAGLEELRMLTNINSGKDELVQLILVGQPELRDTIRQPGLRQFAQRVSVSFHLGRMDLTTTRDYIRHRLTVAGGTGAEFAEGAMDVIFRASAGIPRLVNQLSDLSMIYASSADEAIVSRESVDLVLSDGLLFADMSEQQDDLNEV